MGIVCTPRPGVACDPGAKASVLPSHPTASLKVDVARSCPTVCTGLSLLINVRRQVGGTVSAAGTAVLPRGLQTAHASRGMLESPGLSCLVGIPTPVPW